MGEGVYKPSHAVQQYINTAVWGILYGSGYATIRHNACTQPETALHEQSVMLKISALTCQSSIMQALV